MRMRCCPHPELDCMEDLMAGYDKAEDTFHTDLGESISFQPDQPFIAGVGSGLYIHERVG